MNKSFHIMYDCTLFIWTKNEYVPFVRVNQTWCLYIYLYVEHDSNKDSTFFMYVYLYGYICTDSNSAFGSLLSHRKRVCRNRHDLEQSFLLLRHLWAQIKKQQDAFLVYSEDVIFFVCFRRTCFGVGSGATGSKLVWYSKKTYDAQFFKTLRLKMNIQIQSFTLGYIHP